MENIEKKSKFLSLVLRHQPELIGLNLTSAGWANIEELISKSQLYGVRFNQELIYEIVETSDKQRFALNDDKTLIRANQGHSIAIDLNLPASEPPEHLFHGTATRFLSAIAAQGLIPGSRQQVHLSVDVPTARQVGSRHGQPVVLKINALEMSQDGHKFFLSANGVWLTFSVPPKYIEFPDL